MSSVIEHLFIGKPEKVVHVTNETAILKKAVQKINVAKSAVEGDLCANTKYHGGDNRVLHQYASENYFFWKEQHPAGDFSPGSLGENLSTTGMNESNVCIGDIFQIGTVKCIVTEPRMPCATINQKYQIKTMVKEILNTAKTGWFYRVLEPGTISLGDEIKLLEREFPELTIEACVKAIQDKSMQNILIAMSKNPILSPSWKKRCQVTNGSDSALE